MLEMPGSHDYDSRALLCGCPLPSSSKHAGWPHKLPITTALFGSRAGFLNEQLSSTMLVGIEVAVEYWLALSHSPQAQWLRYSDPSGCLLVRYLHICSLLWWRHGLWPVVCNACLLFRNKPA